MERKKSALKEARQTFVELKESTYANRHLGLSGQLEVMGCDCDLHDDADDDGLICGPSSNCVNRMTYLECFGDECGCDERRCANRRFQKHQYAKIDIFDAGSKGFGVCAREPISAGQFIYEYTGEVLDLQRFLKRQERYQREGIEHFYFMMLQKDEFIDATEKGSLARFCNHSCNPNAIIEKWVVGPKMRMGIFAKRDIAVNEEICFDYKVDRYGNKAQPCLCGEENCSGFLGGRTQTGGALLPPSVIEGLELGSELALEWHEKVLASLTSALGNDLERVLDGGSTNNSSPNNQWGEAPNQRGEAPNNQRAGPNQHPGGSTDGPQDRSASPSSNQSSKQALSPSPSPSPNLSPKTKAPASASLEASGGRSESSSVINEARATSGPSSDSNSNGSARKSSAEPPPSTRSTSAKRRPKKPKTVEYLSLLDLPASSLNETQLEAQRILLSSLPVKPLSMDGVPEFMRILMHAQDGPWLLNLMLQRVLATEDLSTQHGIMNMHGYEIMGTVLNRWKRSENVTLRVLEVLQKWPKVTRNKISSSKIEAVVAELEKHESTDVADLARALAEEWRGLAMGYRIPRRKLTEEERKASEDAEKEKSLAEEKREEDPRSDKSREAARPPKRARPPPEGWEMRETDGRVLYVNTATHQVSRTYPDVRELERQAKRLKNEQEEEKRRIAQLQKEREKQADEIQKIIDAAVFGEPTDADAQQGATPGSTPGGTSANSPSGAKAADPKPAHRLLATYVPKLVFKYEEKLGRPRCKRHARDIVYALIAKEQAKKREGPYDLTPARKNKIKMFVKDYMNKVCERHKNR